MFVLYNSCNLIHQHKFINNNITLKKKKKKRRKIHSIQSFKQYLLFNLFNPKFQALNLKENIKKKKKLFLSNKGALLICQTVAPYNFIRL
jgi:hypothetical protein